MSPSPFGALHRAPLAVVLVLLLACPGRDQGADDIDERALRRGEVELSIGELDGADEYTFARISGIAVDGAGRMFVADNEAHTVRIFSPDGKFIRAIGRSGQGPGEFVEPCCIALRGDTLWVRDGGNARYDVFVVGDTSAVPLTSIRMAHHDVNRWAPVTFDGSGNVIDVGVDPEGRTEPGAPALLARFHLDRTGRVVTKDTVPAPPADSTPVFKATSKTPTGMMTRFIYAPYPPLALRAYSPTGEQARAVSSRYSIAWLGADGRVLRTITGTAEPPALSASEVARAESALVRDMKWIEKGDSDSPFKVPSHKQPLREMYFDLDGRLWVELSVPQGADRRAHVYDRDGRHAYTVEWPPNVNLSRFGAIHGATAYGVLIDSLDVERVARLRLR
jgi:hypothetical protein